ncbi:MAG: ribbon-helix-helix protein, CopG family [Thermoprotei archaeon]|nr:MAG: ribbon-helix-helix protein, CopG family [Thermoprotei archaeon]
MVEVRRYFPTSILLSERQYEGLRGLVAEGKFKSISEAVRAAVDALLEREGVSVEESGEK